MPAGGMAPIRALTPCCPTVWRWHATVVCTCPAAAVAKLVHANTTITKINLRGNSITHAGVAQLKEALIESLSVTSLDLGHNPLGDEGVRLVAGALEACSTVEDLSLDSTGMGAKGLIALTLAAADHPSLRYLNLEGADAQSLQAITSRATRMW